MAPPFTSIRSHRLRGLKARSIRWRSVTTRLTDPTPPASLEQAVQTANALIARGHSLDLGVMQINTKNLRGLRMSVADAFDACKSMAGGSRVLVEGYRPAGSEDSQVTLLRALSHYNTGNQQRGFTNGYVRRVQYAAQQVVPAIRLGGSPVVVAGPEGGEGAVIVQPPAPPPAPPVMGYVRFGAVSPRKRRNGAGPASSTTATVAPGSNACRSCRSCSCHAASCPCRSLRKWHVKRIRFPLHRDARRAVPMLAALRACTVQASALALLACQPL
ncbi:transglycosylase SLT domain-containing protein [Sphingomonas sp. H160509]|uniref:transglycosylase SLT domain-containing protein n=1 Tax=Sphingomonas sp. H160509 TaxID=2955313 RepID=UPI00406D2EC1